MYSRIGGRIDSYSKQFGTVIVNTKLDLLIEVNLRMSALSGKLYDFKSLHGGSSDTTILALGA